MFEFQTALILNRFQMEAALVRLSDREKEEQPSAEDRARAAQKEKDRQEYVEAGVRRVLDWERRVSGGK